MIPYAVMMIPQYALFINFFHWGSGGSLFGYHNLFQFLPQIVPAFFGSPIFIFLLRQFIRGIPFDLDEAAMVDGAGPLRIFWKIILPELRPALAAVMVLTFIGKWNDFLGPLIYLQDPHNWTVELALNGFVGRYGTSVSQSADGGFRDRHCADRAHLLRRLATDHPGRHSQRRQGLSAARARERLKMEQARVLPRIGTSRATVLLVAAVLVGTIGARFVAQRAGWQSHDARPARRSDCATYRAGRLLDGGGSSSGSRGVASRRSSSPMAMC